MNVKDRELLEELEKHLGVPNDDDPDHTSWVARVIRVLHRALIANPQVTRGEN